MVILTKYFFAVCVKAGNQCSNCLPSRLGNFSNQQQAEDHEDTDTDFELVPTTMALPLDSAPSPAGEATSPLREAPQTDHQAAPLPGYSSLSHFTFTWGSLDSADLIKLLDSTYTEVIHWRRNCFSVPNGKAGREFVSELARLYQAFGSASALESLALKATIVFFFLSVASQLAAA